MSTKNAQDLACGDVFWFRGVQYVCLTCVYDERLSIVSVTAMDGRGLTAPRKIYLLSLVRTHKIDVTGRVPALYLYQLASGESEVTEADMVELSAILTAALEEVKDAPDSEAGVPPSSSSPGGGTATSGGGNF